jgi:toxin ParE1/3/4
LNDYHVVFSPEAEEQIAALYHYVSDAASPGVAAGFIEAIISHCETLNTFPLRGISRNDIRPGLRITNYKKRVIIAFDVDSDRVSILGVFYGGQDYATILLDD